MSTIVTVAATQMSCVEDTATNIKKAKALVRNAASKGAQIILLQELFSGLYFCQCQDLKYYSYAHPIKDHPLLNEMSDLAKELQVVLPISFFERSGNAHFNSIVVIDADGTIINNDCYRKVHIPQDPGYNEKFYFSPGNKGYKVWKTAYATIGVGICWDQWFPEVARILSLNGADILFYPTAIGSEPQDSSIDSRGPWQRVMQGHAAANVIPVVASNRVGTEKVGNTQISFYGSSFITDQYGEIKEAAAKDQDEIVLIHTFDIEDIKMKRFGWGVFRDRRPETYGSILSLEATD